MGGEKIYTYGHNRIATPNNEITMPVSPIPTFPRKRGKGQTNRYASFTLLP